jgi:uncharacterized protein with NRDE domain
MCLLLIALNAHPIYPLILAANRDEDYDRPTAPAQFWKESSSVLAGKDLRGGGTWLGITKKGKLGALTNVRNPSLFKVGAPSRGKLVSRFLLGNENPLDYFRRIDQMAGDYSGFNLIAGDVANLWWYSNWRRKIQEVPSGVHGLSNHFLNTPWPKVMLGKHGLIKLLSKETEPSPEQCLDLLSNRTYPPDEDLPDTGIGLEWERVLSPIFIKSPDYGTRCSTVIMADHRARVTFIEKTFYPEAKDASIAKYEFELES